MKKKLDYQELPKLVKLFLEFMQTVKNRSDNTIYEYYYDLKNLFRYLVIYKAGNNPLEIDLDTVDVSNVELEFIKTITTHDFYSYLKYLDDLYKTKTRRNLKPTSRARKTASIKSFFNFLTNNEKLLDKNPVIGLETPQLEKRLPKYLTLDEATSLLHSVKFNEQKFGQRDLCILTLFLNCGLRLGELISIDIKDIKDNRLTVIGKGDKERMIHLNSSCLSSISKYISVRNTDGKVVDKDALFISDRGTRIGRRMVEYIVKKYIELSGLDPTKYTPHKLRHTAATLMHKYGKVDIRTLQQVLGHETIATTQIYTHIDSDEVKTAIDNNPLNRV